MHRPRSIDLAQRFAAVWEVQRFGYEVDRNSRTPDGRLATVKRGETITGYFGPVVFVGLTPEGALMVGDPSEVLFTGETDAEAAITDFDARYPLRGMG